MALEHSAGLLIGKLADGGMRDAISLLDLCISHGGAVTAEVVAQAAGLAGSGHLLALARSFAQKDTASALEQIGALHEKSMDMDRLCSDLVVFYRDLMLLKTVEKPEQLIVALPEEMDDMKPLAQSFSLSRILYTLSVLQETQNRMSRTANRRTELEMSVVRICNPAMDSSAEAVLTRLEELEAAVRKGVSAVSSSFSETAADRSKKAEKQPPESLQTAPDSAIQTASEIKKATVSVLADMSDAQPFGKWQEVLGRLLKTNPPLFAALKNSDAYEKGDLMLIDAKNELFFKLIRENEFAKDSLRDALLAQTGRRYRLGPYRAQGQMPAKPEEDPLETLLKSAKSAGVAVEEK